MGAGPPAAQPATPPSQPRRLLAPRHAPPRPAQALQALGDLAPAAASRLLWFLLHTRQRDPELLQALVAPLYNGLGSLASGELADVLLGYAAAGHYQHELFAAASEFVWDKLPEMEPADLAAAAFAYAGARAAPARGAGLAGLPCPAA